MLHDEAREILVDAYEGGTPARELAGVFGVTPQTVRRLARRRRETGSVALRTGERGRRPAPSAADLAAVDAFVGAHPDATIDEVVAGCGLGGARRDLPQGGRCPGLGAQGEVGARHRAGALPTWS